MNLTVSLDADGCGPFRLVCCGADNYVALDDQIVEDEEWVWVAARLRERRAAAAEVEARERAEYLRQQEEQRAAFCPSPEEAQRQVEEQERLYQARKAANNP